MDPVIDMSVRLGLGLLLGSAALSKLRNYAEFRFVVADYRLLPAVLVPFAAPCIVLLESTLGLLWLTGWPRATVAFGTVLLLVGYGAAIAINLIRGRVFISCGCGFGAAGAEQLSWWLVIRNALLAGLALGVALTGVDARSTGLLDYFTTLMVLVASILVYAALHQLLANSVHVGQWREEVGG
ncbi:MAG: methylamine utilization protein MauE [Gammaproteobacteria bacterium]|nr:methylamine utilization protein MauE [Gammaproteobacteria bacterium]|tara:strand:+ start:1139 stop:1687 length:549 start_codon:yes stop_codon:yes gene_type:complete